MNSRNSLVMCLILSLSICTFWFTGCEESTTNPDPEPARGPFLFVGNLGTAAGSLSQIDLESGAIVTNASALGEEPYEILKKDNKLYVINYKSDSMSILTISDNYIVEIDTTIDLGHSRDRGPFRADMSDNGKIYICNYNAGTVSIFDISMMRTLSHLEVGLAPVDVKYLNGKVFVCNSGYDLVTEEWSDGTITTISTSSNLVENDIVVGSNPRAMAVDTQGRLHVICQGITEEDEGKVWIINPTTDEITQVFTLGGNPEDIAITGSGYAYVAAGGWNEDPGLVYRYNCITGQIYNGPDNPIEVSRGASRLIIGSNNSVYVSCTAADQVDRILDDERVESFDVGIRPLPLIIY